MTPLLRALVDYGHLLGAILGVGGLFAMGFTVLPAAQRLQQERAEFLATLRARARWVTIAAVLLLLGTGLLKWAPPHGVGWLGGRGIYTALLHSKLVLALFVFHLAFAITRAPDGGPDLAGRARRAKLAAVLGLVVALNAVLHHTRALGG